MLESYYKVLGLNMSAALDDIKRRYVELTQIYSLDNDKLKKINEAYRIIMIHMRDICSKYENIYPVSQLSNMTDSEIKELVNILNDHIYRLNNEMTILNKSSLKLIDETSLLDLQSKIATTKYSTSLNRLLSKKMSEKIHYWFYYYFIPMWKKNFEKKYEIYEQNLKENWENDISYFVDTIFLKKNIIDKNNQDMKQMKQLKRKFECQRKCLVRKINNRKK